MLQQLVPFPFFSPAPQLARFIGYLVSRAVTQCWTSPSSGQVRGRHVWAMRPVLTLPGRSVGTHSPRLAACAERGGDPELVRESQRRRYADVGLVDKVLELDVQWREGEWRGEGRR